MADGNGDRRSSQGDREALVEATTETIQVYADLAGTYAATIDRQRALLTSLDETLRKVHELLDRT
jgi:hypothetical protein